MLNKLPALARWAVALVFAVCAVGLHAAPVEIETSAAISKEAGLDSARQEALREAIRQASDLGQVSVMASERMSPQGQIIESSRIRTADAVPEYRIIREWVSNQRLHLLVRFEPADAAAKAQHVKQAYRKKVVVAPFVVHRPSHVVNTFRDFPRELMYRLEKTGVVLARFSDYSIPAENSSEAEATIRAAVRQIAAKQDGQFVISGEIWDVMNVDAAPPSSLFHFPKKRRSFEIHLAVHDGLTGARLAQHRLGTQVEGSAAEAVGGQFGTSDFLATEFGMSVEGVIRSAVSAALDDIRTIPFTAKVVRVAGSKVYINAGATSLIAPGDKFATYQAQDEMALKDPSSQSDYGMPLTPLASIQITQVYPLFAVGQLQSTQKNVSVKAGDLVRFDAKKEP